VIIRIISTGGIRMGRRISLKVLISEHKSYKSIIQRFTIS
jgi:hypothetical protein